MTVQPLVENAVRHGVSRRLDGGSVIVQADRSPTHFTLTVENPTDTEEDMASYFRQGHALWNLRERLRLTYGGRASLEVSRPKRDSVLIALRFPIHP
jgi:LytS/YehU family sensor histidine kinase